MLARCPESICRSGLLSPRFGELAGELGREERKGLLFGEPVKASPQKPVTFPTEHPGPEDSKCQKALPSIHSPHSQGSSLLSPGKYALMGLQCASSFREWLGGCCLLPESEQRQTPGTPTAVEGTLPVP